MYIDPSLLSSLSALMGAFIGGGASLTAAIYTQRHQDRVQRIAQEITKREAVYADFIMNASNLLLYAYIHTEVELNGDEQRLIGLIHRMRLFAPATVIAAAERALTAIIEIMLKPGVEPRELAKRALTKATDLDPMLEFSLVCQADLASVHRTMR